MKRSSPIIPDELKAVENNMEGFLAYKENEERIHQKCFQGITAEQEDFSHLVVSGVRFINCRFWNCSFEKAEFSDTEFESCDLSGCDFQDGYFMEECKSDKCQFFQDIPAEDGFYRMRYIRACSVGQSRRT